MTKKGRVLVAMSGGIDSSVAAMMLHQNGYEVIGMTMKTWEYASSGGSRKETGCCSLDSINDARNLAVYFGFPHYVVDIREEFGNYIIDNFVGEYMAGRTPNPCVLCNTHIKWEALLKRADQLNCEFIATGHYARLREEKGRQVVYMGLDETKDQSYVLWGVSQKNLARTLFPLGKFTKAEIRKIAVEAGFEELAKKSESYEICFIPDNDYRSFLKRKVKGLDKKVGQGQYLSVDGTPIGTHKGYPFYTIGQRKGLDLAVGSPLYVVDINPHTNVVVLGNELDLEKNKMLVKNCNFIKYKSLKKDLHALTKIRYKDPGTMSTLSQVNGSASITANGSVEVLFHHKVRAIAPGQSAVFYEEKDVIGGGVIQ